MAENCSAANCLNCGATLRLIDPTTGLRQCPNLCSGAVWDGVYGWDPASNEAKTESVVLREVRGSAKRKDHPLAPVAEFFGIGWRTLYEDLSRQRGHPLHPRVIGVQYADGDVRVTVDGEALVGTLPAGKHMIRAPGEARYIHGGVYSGLVSGPVPYQTHFHRKRKWLEVSVGTFTSGVNWGYTAYDGNGDIIHLPILSGPPRLLSGQPPHT